MWLYLGIAALLVGIDQLTKWIVVQNMTIGQAITVLPDFFSLNSYRNRGAAWGMLEGKFGFFFFVTIIVVIGLIYFLYKEGTKNKVFAWSIALLLSGAIGNFIDRMARGEVVDFFHFFPFGYNFPIFNVADVCLTFGVIMMLISVMFEERLTKKGTMDK